MRQRKRDKVEITFGVFDGKPQAFEFSCAVRLRDIVVKHCKGFGGKLLRRICAENKFFFGAGHNNVKHAQFFGKDFICGQAFVERIQKRFCLDRALCVAQICADGKTRVKSDIFIISLF